MGAFPRPQTRGVLCNHIIRDEGKGLGPRIFVKISICILTYNRSSLLKNLLLSLEKLNYRPLEIIVIDNCSEDNTQQMMMDEFHYVNYIRVDSNIGASARNFGLKSSTGDIIITLDDDVIGIDDTHITQLIRLFSGTPQLGAVNFKILDYSTGEICNWVHHRPPGEYSEREFATYEITEGAVAFRRSALEQAGYYPEYFFISHEGPDLGLRLMNGGFTVMYCPTISVKHKHSNFGRKAWLNYYFDTRNQFWLAARNFPWSYAATYLARGLGSMLLYSTRDGYLRYWLKAVLDGVKGLPRALGDRKVVRPGVMERIRGIDKGRQSAFSLLTERLLKKGARL